jgi:hypothetical protein
MKHKRFSRERLCFFDEEVLAAQRAALREGDPALAKRRASVTSTARQALKSPVPTLLDKTSRAPSGDPRDYWRLAPYWWPDPRQPGGLPYIRRDGIARPEAQPYRPEGRPYDQTSRARFFDGITALALAWYLTGEMRYARRAARFARAWFISKRTRMNPHLKYAQVRMGHGKEGTGPGIIDFRELAAVLDALRLVARSGALREAEAEAIRAWFADLLRWLRTSRQGREAAAHRNNIGTCYDLVFTAIALFIGNTRLARRQLGVARHRLAAQLQPDGSQPLEERRTRPLHYAIFNLELWADLARVARPLGVKLWTLETDDGRSLGRALGAVSARVRRDRSLPAHHRYRLCILARHAARRTRPGSLPLRVYSGAGVPALWFWGL